MGRFESGSDRDSVRPQVSAGNERSFRLGVLLRGKQDIRGRAVWGPAARDRRNSPIDRYKPFLQAQFAAGNTNAAELYQQIRERGFRGGYSPLTRYVLSLRKNTAVRAPADVPSPRTVTGWIMRPRDSLSNKEPAGLEQARLACPGITHACNLARAFTDVVRHRRGILLDEWICQTEKSDLPSIRSFASSLRQNLDAVTAGLTLPWSSDVVEGHVCKVKLLKRSMYGRASFPLLRTRILRGVDPVKAVAPD